MGDDLLSAGAAKLVGEEIIAFLGGRRALSVAGNQVRIVDAGREAT